MPYTAFIDGGAADERPAGFDASEFVSGVHVPAGFAGRVVVSLVRRYALALTFGVAFGRARRCLTISSEERETWTAGSLRSGFGRARRFGAARELLRRSRFQIHRVLVL
ncbi:hypothetical protein, partial [Lichenibacterium minor]|uniref:hypothetical protein n=1 Tax=Lichenibacterium minor TaxID=2316528 RepID=UPI001A91A8C9